MNVCIISGSARANNNTLRVGLALKRILESGHTVSVIDFREYDIPFVNQGHIEPGTLSPFQQNLVQNMEQAQLIIIITPEYNWSTTPEILNWLHRFGDHMFSPIFDEKVFALVGVSTGKGGKTPVLHLAGVFSKIISFLNLQSVVSPKIFESHFTKEVLDENGNSLGNEIYEHGMNDFLTYTLRTAHRWNREMPESG